MFTNVIDTSIKTKLAAFFLVAPARSFHPEEVRKNTGEPGSLVFSTLRYFVRNGFLKSCERKREIYYCVNQKYPYIEELKGVLGRKLGGRVRDIVSSELERLPNTVLVVLTGLLTGQMRMPTDIVIVGNPAAAALKRAIDNIEKELRQEVNYTVFSEKEFDERVSMYERFTRDLFDNPHVVVFDRRAKPKKENGKKTKK